MADIFKSSFFPQIIRDLNSLTDNLISASECAEGSVTKLTHFYGLPNHSSGDRLSLDV